MIYRTWLLHFVENVNLVPRSLVDEEIWERDRLTFSTKYKIVAFLLLVEGRLRTFPKRITRIKSKMEYRHRNSTKEITKIKKY